jgi:[ribosomal protein S5]-alanine N-acetyltransferase
MKRMERPPIEMESERLFLVRHTAEALLALIDHPERYEEISGFPAAPALREFFVSDEVSAEFLAYLRGLDHSDPWLPGFGVVDRASGTVVGSAGFRGAPDTEGMVEVAYGIVPSHQNRGYATEVTRMLVAWALARDGVRVVRAHTLPESNASTRVLAKCGFSFEGEVDDPEDGRVWRWELAADSRGASGSATV